jgi:6,7-dimethyl-8-ribityllumazine synthase
MKEIAGQLEAGGMKMAIVVSRFNSFFTEQLVKGAADCFVRHGGKDEDLTLVRVPGANEVPQVVQKLAASGAYSAVVALGAVIQGATPHVDLINGTVARALSKIALDTGVPDTFGVITAETLEQAIERAGTTAGNKGWDAAAAALAMGSLFAAL